MNAVQPQNNFHYKDSKEDSKLGSHRVKKLLGFWRERLSQGEKLSNKNTMNLRKYTTEKTLGSPIRWWNSQVRRIEIMAPLKRVYWGKCVQNHHLNKGGTHLLKGKEAGQPVSFFTANATGSSALVLRCWTLGDESSLGNWFPFVCGWDVTKHKTQHESKGLLKNKFLPETRKKKREQSSVIVRSDNAVWTWSSEFWSSELRQLSCVDKAASPGLGIQSAEGSRGEAGRDWRHVCSTLHPKQTLELLATNVSLFKKVIDGEEEYKVG